MTETGRKSGSGYGIVGQIPLWMWAAIALAVFALLLGPAIMNSFAGLPASSNVQQQANPQPVGGGSEGNVPVAPVATTGTTSVRASEEVFFNDEWYKIVERGKGSSDDRISFEIPKYNLKMDIIVMEDAIIQYPKTPVPNGKEVKVKIKFRKAGTNTIFRVEEVDRYGFRKDFTPVPLDSEWQPEIIVYNKMLPVATTTHKLT